MSGFPKVLRVYRNRVLVWNGLALTTGCTYRNITRFYTKRFYKNIGYHNYSTLATIANFGKHQKICYSLQQIWYNLMEYAECRV